EGEPFDPRKHRIEAVVETATKGEDNTVAGCTRDGFRFREVVVRPALVTIKKYREKETKNTGKKTLPRIGTRKKTSHKNGRRRKQLCKPLDTIRKKSNQQMKRRKFHE
ncbi:MAG: nucleotide exchange factor GrpE, partial [bacterium]|nr:nucleotide exchange factor GrpE [bacterium]